jgi:hypothetical protein
VNPERRDFLNLKNTPARLNAEETAWLLGFAVHDIPVLIATGLLLPLGHPPRHGTKYFAGIEIAQLRENLKWLAKASDAIVAHWRRKNGLILGQNKRDNGADEPNTVSNR